jgi:hypothetical protein
MSSRIAIRDAPRGAALPPTPEAFLAELGTPSLLCLPGRDRRRTRAIVTLLHGNEPSGVRALHTWLRRDEIPAVDVVCFLGAIDAALAPPGFAHRMLPGRRDLNRCFRPPWDGPEGAVAGEALRLLRESACEAMIDLHNNTGHNPAYGVGTRLDAASLNLTALFAERFVCTWLRLGSVVEATADDFPSVTIECGRAGDPAADATALAGLRRYLLAETIDTRRVRAGRMAVFDEPVRVTVRPGINLAAGSRPVPGADLTLAEEIDRHNFQPVMPGALLGWPGPCGDWPVEARGADGEDVSAELFEIRDGRLLTRRGMVPIMMTTDPSIATADCLFYVVQQREVIGG